MHPYGMHAALVHNCDDCCHGLEDVEFNLLGIGVLSRTWQITRRRYAAIGVPRPNGDVPWPHDLAWAGNPHVQNMLNVALCI